MRCLRHEERVLYAQASGRRAPFCLVQYWPWWPRGFSGFALGPLVFVRRKADVLLLCHELVHVQQFYSAPLSFWARYLMALWRFGYRNNPYERAACALAESAREILVISQTSLGISEGKRLIKQPDLEPCKRHDRA